MAESIQTLPLEDVIGDRFGRYSKYIIQDRALPDVRDGLKPVQRRILFAMYQDGNTFDKNFRKSAKTVGNVIGNYHPHGDSSVYDAMVRISQDWKLRHVLVEMHGNNGSIDNDPAAAMRYTEAKLSKLAGVLLQDINQYTVDYIQNFDDTAMEPTVLPAKYPNLLVNGSTGISAGYATDIPTHNLGEVIDATLKIIDKPSVTVDELMDIMPGPDFPTGGVIQGKAGIKQAYTTGKGKAVVRGKVNFETLRGGRTEIVITEIPYEVNKATLVKRIDELRADKKVEGILEVRDETDRDGLRIAVELKKDAHAEGILNFLYKNTDLQISYNFNMVAISDRRPKLLGIKDILNSYIAHQKDVITRRSAYELEQANKRMHIVLGLIKALSILDEVIEMIRSSQNKSNAKDNLIEQFEFTEAQAEAIVMLQLYRLTNTDIVALKEEHDQLERRTKQLQSILDNEQELLKVIKYELRKVKKEFSTNRLSKIEDEVSEIKISTEITVPNEEVIVSLTKDGYIKRTSLRSFAASGVNEVGVKDGDYLTKHTQSNLQHTALFFTSFGNYIFMPVNNIPDAKWKDLGTHLSQLVPLKQDERVIQLICVDDFKTNDSVLLATKNGMIKQSKLADFKTKRFTKPMVAMRLKDDDELIVSQVIQGDEDILVITKLGLSLKYNVKEINEIGIKAAGVKSINLKVEDCVVNTMIVHSDTQLFIATQRGAIKRMKIDTIEQSKRAQRGYVLLKEIKSHPHEIVAAYLDDPKKSYELMSDNGQIFSGKLMDIRLSERYTNGSFVVDEDDFGTVTHMKLLEIEEKNN